MDLPSIVPGAEPSLLLPGGFLPARRTKAGCLLLHGFSAQPEEMRFLAEDLSAHGHAVLNQRLAGHGTDPRDLARVRWTDWLASVEDGLAVLRGLSDSVFVIGQSMGGMLALVSAARYPMAGVVALSTPYVTFSPFQMLLARGLGFFGVMARKQVTEHPELGRRREADYPAYPRYPVGILMEAGRLRAAMAASLPQVKVPALLVQSRQDASLAADSLEKIHARLGSQDKEKLWLDGFGHSIVRDEKRSAAFGLIRGGIGRLAG